MNFDSIKIGPDDLQQVLEEYTDSIIIAVSPSCNIELKKGGYSVALIYRKYKKIYSERLYNITSSNKCAIYGLIEGAMHITQPKDIVIMTAARFGFKNAMKCKGVNGDLWKELFSVLDQKGCQSITEIVVEGGGAVLASICRQESNNC